MIELTFPLTGVVPVGYGYEVFGAMSRVLGQEIHGADWLAVLPVRERQLRMRVTPERLTTVLALTGAELGGSGWNATVGEAPRVEAIKPHATLRSWMVQIKGFEEREAFRHVLKQKLEKLGVDDRSAIYVGDESTIRVSTDLVTGFAVTLHGLSDETSVAVQCAGVGGRRRFGCGVFEAC